MNVKCVNIDDKAIVVFTIGKIYEVVCKDPLGIVCIDDFKQHSVMFTHEYEVVDE